MLRLRRRYLVHRWVVARVAGVGFEVDHLIAGTERCSLLLVQARVVRWVRVSRIFVDRVVFAVGPWIVVVVGRTGVEVGKGQLTVALEVGSRLVEVVDTAAVAFLVGTFGFSSLDGWDIVVAAGIESVTWMIRGGLRSLFSL